MLLKSDVLYFLCAFLLLLYNESTFHVIFFCFSTTTLLLLLPFYLDILQVLHPCHKLVYFKAAGWPNKWIEMARGLVSEQFATKYASCVTPG